VADRLEKYSNTAIFLHWLMFFLIFLMFVLGWYMVDLPKGSPERTYFFGLHKSIGLTLALLAVLRLVWRFVKKPPELPDIISNRQQRIANLAHNLLYSLMFIQPATGYISSSFSGYKTKFWGIPLPHWGWKDQVLNELCSDIHMACYMALLCLIVLHIAAAIFHLFNSQVEILKRILPYT